jgi:hypothetical protein
MRTAKQVAEGLDTQLHKVSKASIDLVTGAFRGTRHGVILYISPTSDIKNRFVGQCNRKVLSGDVCEFSHVVAV